MGGCVRRKSSRCLIGQAHSAQDAGSLVSTIAGAATATSRTELQRANLHVRRLRHNDPPKLEPGLHWPNFVWRGRVACLILICIRGLGSTCARSE